MLKSQLISLPKILVREVDQAIGRVAFDLSFVPSLLVVFGKKVVRFFVPMSNFLRRLRLASQTRPDCAMILTNWVKTANVIVRSVTGLLRTMRIPRLMLAG